MQPGPQGHPFAAGMCAWIGFALVVVGLCLVYLGDTDRLAGRDGSYGMAVSCLGAVLCIAALALAP